MVEKFCEAAAVDDAVAHDGGAGDIVAADEGFALVAGEALGVGVFLLGDGAAESGDEVVVAGIARAVDCLLYTSRCV